MSTPNPELGPEWLERSYSKEFDVTFVGDVRQIVDSIAGRGHAFPMFEQGAQTDLLMLAREGLPVDEGHPYRSQCSYGSSPGRRPAR